MSRLRRYMAVVLSRGVAATPYAITNGTTSTINAGAHASIENLMQGSTTIEGWFNVQTVGEGGIGRLFDKTEVGSFGFWISTLSSQAVLRFAALGTTNSIADVAFTTYPAGWKHLAFTLDYAGDKKARVWVDGALAATATNALSGPFSDAGKSLYVCSRSDGATTSDAYLGWVRISNAIRYASAFTPPARTAYPAVDANTVRLWKFNDKSNTIVDYSANAQNATGANITWFP